MQTIDVSRLEPPAAAFSPVFGGRDASDTETPAIAGEPTYALVRSGPAVPSEEVEVAGTLACEVMICWDNQVLHVEHLHPVRPYVVGEPEPGVACDYVIPAEKLGTRRLTLISGTGSTACLAVSSAFAGQLELADGTRMSLTELRERTSGVAGAEPEIELALGTRARFELNGFVFRISAVPAGKPTRRGLFAGLDSAVLGYFGGAFLSTGVVMATMAFLVPDIGLLDEDALARDRLYTIQQILNADAEREQDQRDDATAEQDKQSEGGTGERHAGEEGAMGKPNAKTTGGHAAIKGSPDNKDPHLARAQALQEAKTFGMLSLLTGSPDAPTSPWGRDEALGLDDKSVMGGMWGDELGESIGSGLGLTGGGMGAGGRGEGIGLGDNGFGFGAGLGLRDGFGNGVGRLSGTYKPKPRGGMRVGDTVVSGRLPPEVIQRIVRQNYGRFRMCYEQGLVRNPNLEGRVAVRFVIDRDGSVTNAQNGGTDIPDSGVAGCVVSAFYGLSFPDPQGGIVTVTYPIMFSPG